jgi:hypothetical protein
MANIVTDQYALIDTFGSDVVLKTGRCKVLSITVYAAAAAEIARFKNAKGDLVLMVGGIQDAVAQFAASQPIGLFGLTFDDTNSTLEANDLVIVHFA